jgi:hypothetical protein
MKSWRLAILPLLALAAGGCTVGQHHNELTILQNENRDLEDNLYQQQAALKDLCQQLDACRKDNEALRRRLQSLSPSGPEITPQRPTAPPPEVIKPPSVDSGQPVPPGQLPLRLRPSVPPSNPGPGGLPQAPEAESPPTTEAPPYTPPSSGAEPPAGEAAPFTPPSAAPPYPATKPLPESSSPSASHRLRSVSPAPQLGRAVHGDNSKVAAIGLRPLTASGHRDHQSDSANGLGLWIEPRDQAGNPIRAAAPLSVVVLDPDPSLSGEAARVARWDFSSEAAGAFYRKTATTEGIFLELTWPGDPPKHGIVEIFVRYTTDDGRKIEARRRIHLDAANPSEAEPHAQWSRRPAPAPVATTAYPTTDAPSAATQPGPASPDVTPSYRAGRASPAGDDSAEKPKLQRPAWSPDRP